MLDVAFDSVVTMDEGGVVVGGQPRRGADVRLRGGRDGRDELVADVIIPPALRDAHRDGLARYLKTGRGPVVGRRVELTAMRKDGTEFPVELVVTRPEVPGEHVFYGYLRDLTSRYRAEAALHRLADEQAALRRVATAVAAESDPVAVVRARQRGGRAAARRRRPRALMRFDGDHVIAVGALEQARRPRRAGRHDDAAARRHRRRTRVCAPARPREWRTTSALDGERRT